MRVRVDALRTVRTRGRIDFAFLPAPMNRRYSSTMRVRRQQMRESAGVAPTPTVRPAKQHFEMSMLSGEDYQWAFDKMLKDMRDEHRLSTDLIREMFQ